MALTPDQVRAAHLLGAGHTRNNVAAELNVAPSTVTRWSKSPPFQDVVKRANRVHVGDHPEPRSILLAALSAVTTDGRPDHRIRVAAALKLMDLGPAPEEPAPDPPEVWDMEDEDEAQSHPS